MRLGYNKYSKNHIKCSNKLFNKLLFKNNQFLPSVRCYHKAINYQISNSNFVVNKNLNNLL